MKKIVMVTMALAAMLMVSTASVEASPGLVGLWHLDGDASDSSGNGNDGTVTGATYASGMFDQALSFDGDDYVEVADDDSLSVNEAGAVTVEAWIQPTDGATLTGLVMIVGKWNDEEREYEIMLSDGKVRFYGYGANTGTQYAESSTTLVVDTQYHVAGVWDGSELQVYIDGSADGSSTAFAPDANIPNTAARLTIGAQFWGGVWQRDFTGIIDEVRIWDEALSADAISDSASLADIEITKELISPTLDPDTNGNGIDEVPMATEIEFEMRVTVTNGSDVDLSSAMVRDPLPAELELADVDPLIASVGVPSSYLSKGKSKKVFVEWDLDDLLGTGPETLDITAHTDINPGNPKKPHPKGKVHQEYTSPDIYDLNAGASMSFSVNIAGEDIGLVLNSDGLLVEAVGTESD